MGNKVAWFLAGVVWLIVGLILYSNLTSDSQSSSLSSQEECLDSSDFEGNYVIEEVGNGMILVTGRKSKPDQDSWSGNWMSYDRALIEGLKEVGKNHEIKFIIPINERNYHAYSVTRKILVILKSEQEKDQ